MAAGARRPWVLSGYNPGDGLIEGSLPDGTYTVQVTTYGPNAMAGMLNITVRVPPFRASRHVAAQSVRLP